MSRFLIKHLLSVEGNPIELRRNYLQVVFVMKLQSKNNSLIKISFTSNDVGDCIISAIEIFITICLYRSKPVGASYFLPTQSKGNYPGTAILF